MKYVLAFLLLLGIVLGQYPSGSDILADYQKASEYFYSEALKFVENQAIVLDERLTAYIAAHQKLATHFTSLRQIPGVSLSANSEQILNRITARIQNLIEIYPKVLDRNIFKNELQKYMNILTNGPLNQAEGLIKELAEYVTKYPAIGKCWQDNRDVIMGIVANGFLGARNAALTTVRNANGTLNTNEFLINALISTDNAFISFCKTNGFIQVDSCIEMFLSTASVTFPGASLVWEISTNATVGVNLRIAEGMIQTTTQTAVAQITQAVYRIESCVKDTLRNITAN